MKQSPTMAAIRLQNKRWPRKKPAPKVEAQQVVRVASRAKTYRAKVTAKGADRKTAIRHAVRAANSAIAQEANISLVEFRSLQARLAGITALLKTQAGTIEELKALNARLVEEVRSSAGHTVVLELERSSDDLASELRACGLSSSRWVAHLPEYIGSSSTPIAMPTVETRLLGKLVEQGFTVFDTRFLESQGLQKLARGTLGNRPADEFKANTQSLGEQCLANIVLAGEVRTELSQKNNGILSYYATANLRATQVQSGKIVLSDVWRVKGFGVSEKQAASNSLEQLAIELGTMLPERLRQATEGVMVAIAADTEREDHLKEIEKYVQTVPYLESVQHVQTDGGAVLRVRSKEPAAVLAADIEKNGQFQVVE